MVGRYRWGRTLAKHLWPSAAALLWPLWRTKLKKRMEEETWRRWSRSSTNPDCRKCMLEARPFLGRGKFRCVSPAEAHKNAARRCARDDVDFGFSVFSPPAAPASDSSPSRDDGNGPINTSHWISANSVPQQQTDTVLDDHLCVHLAYSLQKCALGIPTYICAVVPNLSRHWLFENFFGDSTTAETWLAASVQQKILLVAAPHHIHIHAAIIHTLSLQAIVT